MVDDKTLGIAICIAIILVPIILVLTAQYWAPLWFEGIREFFESIPGFEPLIFVGIFTILVISTVAMMHYKFKNKNEE